MALFRKLTIANASAHYDTAIVDRYNNCLVFASMVGYETLIKDISKEINKINNVYLDGAYTRTVSKGYEIDKRKQSNSDFAHLLVYKKDVISSQDTPEEKLLCYVFFKTEEERNQAVYDKLYKNTSIPILQEWIPYLVNIMINSAYLRNTTMYYDNTDGKGQPFYCYSLHIKRTQLLEIVQAGLRTGAISVNGTNSTSANMGEISGLDNYLNSYGDTLARRIQASFVPRFIPGETPYDERVNDYDDACFHGGIEMFDAQKDVLQASVINLDDSRISLVVGEMGSGKTLIGAGIPYAHYGKTGFTSIIMCPAHLTKKWKREIERLVPNGEAVIVKHIKDVMALDNKIRNKNKKKNLYIIISKENAKFGYESRPSTLWSNSKKTFVCPECGKTLFKEEYTGVGRNRYKIDIPFNKKDMTKPLSHNMTCANTVKYWDKQERKWNNKKCNANLWAPLNGSEADSLWVKLGAEGWVLKEHLSSIFNDMASKDNLSRKDATFFAKLTEKKIDYERDGNVRSSSKAPRKYPIAKYIRERYKGVIDYLIADEIHQLKGSTEQGQAFGDLAQASKQIIGLTGTLLNGYADSLFYILYRTMAHVMLKEGFEYLDEAEFMRSFGVIRKTNRFELENGREGSRIGNGSEKRLPGVSPLVFTKFLLEHAVFLSLSDMSEGLPPYTEIPISVPMDQELATTYAQLEADLRRCSAWRGSGGMKAMGAMLQTLSVYPDQPYDQPPIIHPDSGEVLVVPPSLSTELRNKERRLLEMVREKVDNGEKVLIYYNWTNRTDVAEKVTQMLSAEDINCANLTASVTPDKREEWIDQKLEEGIDVLICNPTLVETGLDLLPFTTIIFYQVGYNIFTMRQASRRSWRLSQTHPIEVYFLYYEQTIQEQALSLMATKLQASMAIEGKFSEEGLRAMSNNEDLLTQIANSVVNGIKYTVDAQVFKTVSAETTENSRVRIHRKTWEDLLEEEIEDIIESKIVAAVIRLAYLERSKEQQSPRTATHNMMLDLFNNKKNIGNLI